MSYDRPIASSPQSATYCPSFNVQYTFVSLRSGSSSLPLLLRLFATSIVAFIFPSVMCFKRQFVRKI
jgi:hypothetical protein